MIKLMIGAPVGAGQHDVCGRRRAELPARSFPEHVEMDIFNSSVAIHIYTQKRSVFFGLWRLAAKLASPTIQKIGEGRPLLGQVFGDIPSPAVNVTYRKSISKI